MKKKNFVFIVAIISVLSPSMMKAQKRFTVQDITYQILSADTVAVAESKCSQIIEIPQTVMYDDKSYVVGTIESNFILFSKCESLTSITIPNSIKKIGSSAFRNVKNLTSITLPNSIKKIESGAFRDCTGLTSIILPDSIEYIANGLFSNCTSLTSLTIPSSVKTIYAEAFSGCINLMSVALPDSIIIERGAFKGCINLHINSRLEKYLLDAWEKTKEVNKLKDVRGGYQDFINDYPFSKYVTEAKERIEEIESRTIAEVIINYPKTVKSTMEYRYVNGRNTRVPVWTWKTLFNEKYDNFGFYLSESQLYSNSKQVILYNPQTVNVARGDRGSFSTTVIGESFKGNFKRIWVGKDSKSNTIRIEEIIHLE